MALNAYRYRFYGGDSGAEQAFLLSMYAKGYTAASVLSATDSVLTGKGTTKVGASGTQVTLVNTTTRTAMFTQALGAATTGDEFVLTAWGDQTNSNGSSINYTHEVVLGTTVVATGTQAMTNIATTGNRRRWWLETNIILTGTAAQSVGGVYTISTSGASTGNTFTFGAATTQGVVSSTATEDMSTTKDLAFYITMSAAATSVDFRLGGYSVVRRR